MIELRFAQQFFAEMSGKSDAALDAFLAEQRRMKADEKERTAKGEKPKTTMEQLMEYRILSRQLDEMFPPPEPRRRDFDDFPAPPMLAAPLPPEPRRNPMEEFQTMFGLVSTLIEKTVPKGPPPLDPAIARLMERMEARDREMAEFQKTVASTLDSIAERINNPPEEKKSGIQALIGDVRAVRELQSELGGGRVTGDDSWPGFLNTLTDRLPDILSETRKTMIVSEMGDKQRRERRAAILAKRKAAQEAAKGNGKPDEATTAFLKNMIAAQSPEELLEYGKVVFATMAQQPERRKVAEVILRARGGKLKQYLTSLAAKMASGVGPVPEAFVDRMVAMVTQNRKELAASLTPAS
jgi:hypothetical protein